MSNPRLAQFNLSSKEGYLYQAIARILSPLLGEIGLGKMTPTIGPDFPAMTAVHNMPRPRGGLSRERSSPSNKLDDNFAPHRPIARSASSSSIMFDDGEVDPVRVEGLRHANVKLGAR